MVVMQFKNIRLRFDYLIVFTCLTPALLFWARDLVVNLGSFGDLGVKVHCEIRKLLEDSVVIGNCTFCKVT